LSSKLIRRRMMEIRVFRSIGVVFSLTNEGHIDVMRDDGKLYIYMEFLLKFLIDI
jgi:hypothetical protein